METYHMGLLDYVAICVIVFISIIPGLIFIYRARNVKSTRDFLFSSKGLGQSPISLSLAATALAGGIFIATPSEVYRHGIVTLGINIGYMIAVLIQTHLYLPIFFDTEKVSIYEYLERRYNRKVRLFVSGISSINTLMTTSLAIYIPAICLSQASGIDIWYSVIGISGVCISYTSFGGFKAVVWSDAFQLLIMVAVLFGILIKGVTDQGSLKNIWKVNEAANRTMLFSMTDDINQTHGFTFWTVLFGSIFAVLANINSQSYVQRLWASGKFLQARRSAYIGYGVVITFHLIIVFVGLAMYSKFHNCDPLTSGKIKTHDQELILFVAEIFNNTQGVVGIFFAGLLCSCISTISSHLNSGVCFIMEDFLKPWSSNWSESKTLTISKIIGVCYGCLSLSFISVFQNIPGLISALYITLGLIGAPILGIFTLGMISPWTKAFPACVGSFTSIAFIGWASVGRMIAKPIVRTMLPSTSSCNVTGWTMAAHATSNTSAFNYISTFNNTTHSEIFSLYTYHPYWYPCWSTLMTIAVGLIATPFLGAQNPDNVDRKLFFPFIIRMIDCLPRNIAKCLGFETGNANKILEHREIGELDALNYKENDFETKCTSPNEGKTTGENHVV